MIEQTRHFNGVIACNTGSNQTTEHNKNMNVSTLSTFFTIHKNLVVEVKLSIGELFMKLFKNQKSVGSRDYFRVFVEKVRVLLRVSQRQRLVNG